MDDQEAQQHEGSPELFMFLASTVHDMKNSISVLSGTLENLLAAHQSTSAPEYSQMAHMLYQTKRLNDNLIQLLALYKDVGKPGYPFDPAPRSVRELVEQVEGQARMLLQSRGVTLDIDYPQHAIWSLDEDLVIGVLVHAINNAIRYTRDRVRMAITIDGDYLEVRVEDNGLGFPNSLLEAGVNAMDPQRSRINFLNNSSGLGLYFSSEVAKMHKHRQRSGSIALENGGTLGGGCFILRLP
ncbi:sensor histidine kinase [Duganella sp. CY15W]|uniref:sensor histidine kinase n=1 Tax=Duganella sp. CY15W TaxID=2692172 RepID=UPI00136DAAD5|nr:HAMP domain-containing sensor histidine kinase [Duganella sp. CY15W]MYM28710.1 sensor histidine kinase [Duganella sp. CY15W]